MIKRRHGSRFWLLAGAAGISMVAGSAGAAEIMPHKATYDMTLERARPNSGIVGISGELAYQWGETCEGWTIEQRYKLTMQYQEEGAVEIGSTFVTWESKDGKSYRFNERKTRNGQLEEDIKGDAGLKGQNGAGRATFTKPKDEAFELPQGSLFPTAHTLLLLKKAEAGEHFVSAQVFDGSSDDGAAMIGAVVGPKLEAKPGTDTGVKSPLLNRPSWNMRLAFFPAASKDQQPDYELGMRLLDNGVSSEMTLDYGDYIIKAKLKEIQALTKPAC